MTNLSLSVLGSFRASLGDKPFSEFRTNKVRALLIYLAIQKEPQSREYLLELLWPGLPELSARANLRQIVYYLRKSIPEVNSKNGTEDSVPLVVANRQALQLNPAADVQVDAKQFDAYVQGVQGHEHEELSSCDACLADLIHAIDLYRGDFLADFYLDDSDQFEEWAQIKREAYRHKVLDFLHILTSCSLHRQELVQAQALAERQIEIDNLHESAYRQLMEILALNGQRAEAITIYETCHRLLAEELAMAPSRRTTEIYEKISAGDLSFERTLVQRVQGYDLKEKIGEGAYGSIHKAVQPSIGRDVAIKVIHRNYANDPDFIRRFEAEAQTVARLEHPFIVPLYDYWRDPDGAYLVMRYLRGGNLLESLASGPWDLEGTARMLEQVTGALSAAHHQGVIHRDIKPANILLDESGNAFLSDFGIAKDLTSEKHLTLEHSVIGTPEYFSPEQIKNDPVSVQSDIYSLGLVLYETLTGEKPFPDSSVVNLIYSHLNKPVPLVGSSRPDLQAEVDDVIQRATAKQPADRFGSALEMASAFRDAVMSIDVDPAITGAPIQPAVAEIYNPYKGLRAFQENDADDFFGRDALVEQLLARLDPSISAGSMARRTGNGLGSGPGTGLVNRFLAIVGPSGSGKSSAVKAGLIPALRKGALPAQGNLAASDKWFIAEMVPGTHPLEELELALWSIAVDPPPSLVEPMQRDTRGMLRTIRRILPDDQPADTGATQLLLVIDQFEELFTLVQDDERRQFFIDSLLASIQAPRSPLRVIVTLRADFYDRPLQHPHLGQFLKANTEIVLPLDHTELTWAIREPARRMGVSVAQGLVEEIASDVADQPGALPLLQYAMTELFDNRQDSYITRSAYEEIGGVAGALGRRAEGIYADLDEVGKAAARQLFLRLVTIGEGVSDVGASPDTRRRVLRSELEALTTADGRPQTADVRSLVPDPKSPTPGHPGPASVLDSYGRARLLTFDRDPVTREPTVEVAHEALLREWPRFRSWLDESRADVRLQRMLDRAAAEWMGADHDAGFLLRDARLDHFAGWALTSTVALTGDERGFLDASIDARESRQAEERERQKRELQTAQKLAETEKARAETESARAEEQTQAAGRLRRRAVFLASALVVAALLAAAAVFFARQSGQNASAAQDSAGLAITREAEALVEAEQRATAEIRALSQAATAEAAQAEAQIQQSLAEEQAERADTAAAEALDQRLVAEEQAKLATSRELVAEALNKMDVDSELGVLLALQALSVANTVEARNALYRTVPELRLLETFSGHTNSVSDFDLNRDGTLLASFDIDFVRVWEVESGQELYSKVGFTNVQQTAHRGVALSPDGTLAAFTGQPSTDSPLRSRSTLIINIASGQELHALTNHGQLVNDISFNPDGTLLATGLSSGEIIIWDVASGKELSNIIGHSDSSTAGLPSRSGTLKVAFSPDGSLLVTSGADGTVKVWQLSSGREVATITGHLNEVNSVAFNPEGSRLVTAGHDGTVRIWALQSDSGETSALLTLFANQPIASAEFSPDGALFATGGSDGIARIWDAYSGRQLQKLTGHQGAISNVIFTPDGSRLITSSDDTTIKIWNISPDRELITLFGDGSSMESVQFSPDGDRLASMTLDGTLQIWDSTTGENLLSQPSELAYQAAVFSPDGSRLAKVSDTSDVQIVDSESGDWLFTLSGITSRAQALAWSPDGSRLATTGLVGDVIIWDASNGESLQAIYAHLSEVIRGLAFSPDGERLVSAGWDNLASIWDVEDGNFLSSLATPPSPYSVVFSPDGKLLAVSGGDGTAAIWDVASGNPQLLVTIAGHTLPVPGLAFSPDGAHLVTGSLDGTVKIWDVAASIAMESGQEISTLSLHEGGVLDVAYSPDGRRLATASQDGTVKVTIVDFEELVALAQERLTRGFTEQECQQYLHEDVCPDQP